MEEDALNRCKSTVAAVDQLLQAMQSAPAEPAGPARNQGNSAQLSASQPMLPSAEGPSIDLQCTTGTTQATETAGLSVGQLVSRLHDVLWRVDAWGRRQLLAASYLHNSRYGVSSK